MRKVMEEILTEGYSFEKRSCSLSFSCASLEFETSSQKTVTGSFRVIAEDKYKPQGYVYSNDLRMLVRNGKFGGLQTEIFFQYDPQGLEPGSVQEGVLYVVSNLGEYEIPYRISITGKLPDSSLGIVKNLFHFANLAKCHWQEALDLFYSPGFEHVLTGYEAQYLKIYRGLSAIPGNEQNMETFLVHTLKKSINTYDTDVKKVERKAPKETLLQSIKIERDGWGYSRLKVETVGDFLFSEQEEITTKDFEGNVAVLNYYINHHALHAGKNFGEIILHDPHHRIVIPVTVLNGVIERKKEEQNVGSDREISMRLMRAYLSFRTGKMSKNEWTKECNVMIHRLVTRQPNHLTYRLYQVQILLTEKRYDEAANILERIGYMIKENKPQAELEGYYYYLCSLYHKEESVLKELAQKVEYLYVRDVSNWRLAWFMLYMKEEYASNDYKKWELLRKQYEYGNCSPVMFLEALHTMLNTPAVMAELGDFELAFLTFVKRHNVMTREIRNRFVFLCGKVKAFSAEIFALLTQCYQMEEKEETLQEICAHLMRGNKIGQEYFKWYEKAVEQELRLTRLYEYYMMSIDLGYRGKLPKMILMYFAYRSNLDYERSAFLYANIWKYQKEYQDIFEEYRPKIEEFAAEQIGKGRVDDNLAYLYKEIIFPMTEDSYFATAYARLCFMHRITVPEPSFKNVIVVYEHLKKECSYPLYQGEAVFPLVGRRHAILLEDEEGNRCSYHVYGKIVPLLKEASIMETVMLTSDIFLPMALFMAENAGEKVQVSHENEAALLWLIEAEEITEEYRIEIRGTLMDYYFEQDEIAKLEELLLRCEPDRLGGKEREDCVRIMVALGMYERAFEWVRNFGMEYIDYKILVRLCDRLLMRTQYEYEPELVKICEGVFQRGKYDETILNYLILYAQSSTMNLKSLWRAAESFNLDVHELLENMLVQILYTQSEVGEESNIFREYVEYGANAEIEKAFLSYLSYRYLFGTFQGDKEVFDRAAYLVGIGEDVSMYCKLAYVKKCIPAVRNGKMKIAERDVAVSFVEEARKKGIFLTMFLEYKKWVPELELLSDHCYIEYFGKKGSKVILHYVVERASEEEPEYRKEEMHHMYGGIYSKGFILFYGEKVNYYITEEDARTEKLTKSSVLQKEESQPHEAENRFQEVNHVVISHDMQDDVTYCNLSKEYVKKCFMVDRLFLPDHWE